MTYSFSMTIQRYNEYHLNHLQHPDGVQMRRISSQSRQSRPLSPFNRTIRTLCISNRKQFLNQRRLPFTSHIPELLRYNIKTSNSTVYWSRIRGRRHDSRTLNLLSVVLRPEPRSRMLQGFWSVQPAETRRGPSRSKAPTRTPKSAGPDAFDAPQHSVYRPATPDLHKTQGMYSTQSSVFLLDQCGGASAKTRSGSRNHDAKRPLTIQRRRVPPRRIGSKQLPTGKTCRLGERRRTSIGMIVDTILSMTPTMLNGCKLTHAFRAKAPRGAFHVLPIIRAFAPSESEISRPPNFQRALTKGWTAVSVCPHRLGTNGGIALQQCILNMAGACRFVYAARPKGLSLHQSVFFFYYRSRHENQSLRRTGHENLGKKRDLLEIL